MLPEASQARKAIWESVNPHTGIRRIDEAFPHAIRETTRENEMFIRFVNGATWQVVGSDNFNSLVGSPPVGVVFSEWALANPGAWDYMRPILAENGGWALFITTPRGRNHAATMFEAHEHDPEWFVERLTADQTGVFDQDTLYRELRELKRINGPEDGQRIYDQEYMCSFEAAIPGAYYGSLMLEVEQAGRICGVPHDPAVPVHTAWDLGISDSTCIWIFQMVGREIHFLEMIENSAVGLDWYVKELQSRGYLYAEHILPHDAEARELGTGRTRKETLESLGLKNIKVIPAQSVADGINAVRLILPRAYFDKDKCDKGVSALRAYRREWDDKRKSFKDYPLHDWASHASDAMRYAALGLPSQMSSGFNRKITYTQRGIV